MTTFDEAVRLIDGAGRFADLVAVLPGLSEHAAYRQLVKLVHPDAVSPARRATATDAAAKLGFLWRQRHDAGRMVAQGDIADLFAAGAGLLKMPRDPRDNDLMEAEADALRRLREKGDPRYRPYAPKLLDSYLHEDADRKRRRANVIERLTGFVPLGAVRRRVDPRDAAWMWRRLLVGLGWAHRAGVVHGAVFEEHVLIHPEEHGLALVDWCYAGETPAVMIKDRDYPPEVTRDRTAGPATDIYLATTLMKRLIGDGMPAKMRRFADGCLYDAPRMRPQDAWRLLDELDDLLHSLYGPRKFRPFTI